MEYVNLDIMITFLKLMLGIAIINTVFMFAWLWWGTQFPFSSQAKIEKTTRNVIVATCTVLYRI